MSEQHTPGPWHRNVAPATKYNTIFAGRNEHIASIRHAKDGAEAEANHNLICAAPDLLAALEAVTHALQAWVDIADVEDDRESDHDAIHVAHAALAKARGES